MLSEEKLNDGEFIVGCYGYLCRQYNWEQASEEPHGASQAASDGHSSLADRQGAEQGKKNLQVSHILTGLGFIVAHYEPKTS